MARLSPKYAGSSPAIGHRFPLVPLRLSGIFIINGSGNVAAVDFKVDFDRRYFDRLFLAAQKLSDQFAERLTMLNWCSDLV